VPFRVGLFALIIGNRGPVGIGESLNGMFIRFWVLDATCCPSPFLSFSCAQRTALVPPGGTMVVGLIALTAVMSVGIFGIATFMWRPLGP